jgi:predicted amidohydrolase YtcJ
VIASMHPIGAFTPAMPPGTTRTGTAPQGAWAVNLGPERAARGGMWKSIRNGGGAVAFGSDWPVASLNAMARLSNIVNRGPRPGGTDQRLSWSEAVDAHTRVAAFAAFDEETKGTLAPGMLADVVVLETDVFSRPPATVEDVAVHTTIVDGKVVYQRGMQ